MGLFQYGNAFLPDRNNTTPYLAVTTIAVESDDLTTSLYPVSLEIRNCRKMKCEIVQLFCLVSATTDAFSAPTSSAGRAISPSGTRRRPRIRTRAPSNSANTTCCSRRRPTIPAPTIPPVCRCSTITAASACSTTRSPSRNTAWGTTTFSITAAILNGERNSSSVPTGCVRTSNQIATGSPSGTTTSTGNTAIRSRRYSALAQGQGISVLVRAHKESGDVRYLESAQRALAASSRRPIPVARIRLLPCDQRSLRSVIVLARGANFAAQSPSLRSGILVALRAVGHAPAHGDQSFLSSIAHRAAARDAPTERRRHIRARRRSLGELQPQPQ